MTLASWRRVPSVRWCSCTPQPSSSHTLSLATRHGSHTPRALATPDVHSSHCAVCTEYATGTAVAYYIAMYAPHFALVPIFGARLAYNVRRMLRGEQGPWSALNAAAGVGSVQRAPASCSGPGGMSDPQPAERIRALHEGATLHHHHQGRHPEVLI